MIRSQPYKIHMPPLFPYLSKASGETNTFALSFNLLASTTCFGQWEYGAQNQIVSCLSMLRLMAYVTYRFWRGITTSWLYKRIYIYRHTYLSCEQIRKTYIDVGFEKKTIQMGTPSQKGIKMIWVVRPILSNWLFVA